MSDAVIIDAVRTPLGKGDRAAPSPESNRSTCSPYITDWIAKERA